MLRVVVESAKALPKKTVGSPDPIVSVTFKGKMNCRWGLNYSVTCCVKFFSIFQNKLNYLTEFTWIGLYMDTF